MPVPSSPDCSTRSSLSTLAGESTQTPGIDGERKLRGGRGEEDRHESRSHCNWPPIDTAQRGRRADQEQRDDVEEVPVADDSLAEADR